MGLKGTNQEYGRPYNRRIVLEIIRLKGPISRAAIARDIALSPQTVSNIIRELEESGLLLTSRESGGRRGQPATMLAINPAGAYAIGLQLTPARVRAMLVDLAGEEVGACERVLATLEPDVVFGLMTDLVTELRTLRPEGRLLGIGLAMPGPFDVEPMSFVGATTIEGWRGIPIEDELGARTGLPVFIGIDSAAAALGELLYGAGRDFRDFFYVYFSAGLGGGAIHDGQVWRGAYGNAGELGHVPLVPDGEPCPCGNRGCLERYISVDALARHLARSGVDLGSTDLPRLVADDHPALDGWIADIAPLFARALVMIENLHDPETVIVGGLLPLPLMDRLIAAVEPLPPSVAERTGRSAPRLIRSDIGAEAALLGAAVLAISGVLSPRFGLLFADGRGAEGRGAEGRSAGPVDPLIAGTGQRRSPARAEEL
jgi:predicted NBD/HSP70 family sugar kinase